MPAPVGFALFALAVAPLPLLTNNGYILRVGFDTLIYMLLALGLNIVVGFAGLLDLGYVAFFGFGAYGYAMLASSQFNQHWPTLAIIPLVTAASALLGLVVALPSRRLVGDYLAIVTLFFGQLFVTVTNNGESMSLFGLTGDHNITNGPNGIANIDPFHLFGHQLESLRSYFYVALVFFLVVLGVVYLVGESRIGRAWRSLREDPLAAELMGMPINRLKLSAFAFGAGVAGLTGTLFASLQTAVFSSDFDTPVLILVYAILILGGAGSLGGVILGALVVNISLEVLRTPGHATIVFFVLIIATLLVKLRPWRRLAGVVAGTAAFGFAVRAVVGAIWPFSLHSPGAVGGTLGSALAHWVPLSANYQVGNYGFCALVGVVLVLTDGAAALADAAAPADALPRHLRLGQQARLRALDHPPHLRRGHPDGAHERATAGTDRCEPGRDRLMGGERLLELRGVSKSFGGLATIVDLDLHVERGEILSVIGPNGAGKTTLFNLVTGVYAPDQGEIVFAGGSLLGLEPHEIVARGIARTFQTLRLFLNLSVKENVMAAAYSHTRAGILRSILRTPGMRREEREIEALAEERLAFFGQRLMGYRWDQPAYSLSYANRRRLEIARATATKPSLLLLDEPAAGMNPVETHEITELIAKLRADAGYTILVIEHDMHVVEGISDRVIALDHGVKIAEGSFETVATNERVIEAYLGLKAAATP